MQTTPVITIRKAAVLEFIFRKDMNPQTALLDPPASEEEIALVTAELVDLKRGGLQARAIDPVRKDYSYLYRLAWEHRMALWDRRIAAGEAKKLRVTEIPRGTLRGPILSGLDLPLDTHLGVERFPEATPTVSALVIATLEDASRLLTKDSRFFVAGKEVLVTEA